MGTQAHAALAEKTIPCIARQPILSADESVIAYELLLRDDPEETRSKTDTDQATRATIDALNLIGLGVLCDGRAAFIPCTHAMLLMGYFSLLPPAEVVIELQDKVPDDEQVRAVCEGLKHSGYRVALDNFAPSDGRTGLVQYADFLKIDIRQYPSDQTAALVERYGSKVCRMLATKVETRQNFVDAKHSGFTLYQGYFFRHPERLRARQIPGNQAIYLQLLQEVAKPTLDFNAIEELIKRELSLCYRLLRYLNSPLLALASPVSSVRHALTLLGERETVRWIRMATTLVMGQEKASDLVLSCLVRAVSVNFSAPRFRMARRISS